MKIDKILQNKGGSVHTVQENDSITDAIAMLNMHRIGALVVLDADGALAGIVSERDIVKRLGKGGATSLTGTVRQCMTAKPFTCTPDTSLDEVMHLMTDRRVRHIPVLEGSTLVGIISIGDVVKRKIEQVEHEAAALREYIAS